MIAPSFDTLRALVRGELAPAERRAVSEWLVLHADEQIGAALHALAIEWREVRQDRSLEARAAEISAAFWPVFAAGFADIDPEPAAPKIDLLLARTPPVETAAISVVVVDAHTRIVRVRTAADHQLLATNDRGEVLAVASSQDYVCAREEGRITFWALADDERTPTSDLVVRIEAALGRSAVNALRLTEAFFEP